MVTNLRASKHARFLQQYAPLAENLGFGAPRTRLHPLLSATTKVALPRDHERGREEVGFAGRADRCLVRRCFQDLWILSIGIDNNPWGQYQPLIPVNITKDFNVDFC